MSTHLEFFNDLPKICFPAAIKIQPMKQEFSNDDDHHGGGGDECRTPTSKENKIPAIEICPPAPRKPRRSVSCKRKLSTEFFEIEHREEVERFLRSGFDMVAAKRRCPCT